MTCDGQCGSLVTPALPMPMHGGGEYSGGMSMYGNSQPCGGMPYASQMVSSSSYSRMQDSYMR